MQPVYNECTCCYRPLSEADQQLNRNKGTFYYTICTDCLNKYTSRILRIADQE